MKRKSLKDKTDRELIIILADALMFYADPMNYFAITILPDPPCGDFADDFSDTRGDLGVRPGKTARKALGPVMMRELNRRWPVLGPNSDTRGPNKKVSKRPLKKRFPSP